MYSDELNADALLNPQPGDYWSEHFCPYFIVVQVDNDNITILNCIDQDKSKNAIINHKDYWSFDYSKGMVVDKEWIKKQVTYNSIAGFCADVSRTEKYKKIAKEWVEFQTDLLLDQIRKLGPTATLYMMNR